jgi:hypothetical protein
MERYMNIVIGFLVGEKAGLRIRIGSVRYSMVEVNPDPG